MLIFCLERLANRLTQSRCNPFGSVKQGGLPVQQIVQCSDVYASVCRYRILFRLDLLVKLGVQKIAPITANTFFGKVIVKFIQMMCLELIQFYMANSCVNTP